ncbi:T9SS type A sorting domain-containing protein [Sanyastnella coralliicola]|uniref:T9SS type A sorting domain-containing protein n=1 Tax=Sanyastnella coralliicola TaxID=3069118 RepID=UPI0027B98269|nr:T9SS type A sorting domain-containing protein [Longitalea sp. SCSIO 12813]
MLALRQLLEKALIVALLCGSSFYNHVDAQVFDGISIQEVPIDPALAATIQTEAGFTSLPRTWRVYACMNQDFYELQAVSGVYVGGVSYPMILECPGCTGANQFYQSPFGGFLGNVLNPAFFGVFPQAEFDSYFTIGDPYSADASGITWVPDPGADPSTNFEAGGSFNEPALSIGSVVSGFWAPPSTQGVIDAQYRVMIGQFTTDGVFNGQATFQFRQLNADYTVFTPVNIQTEYNVTWTNQPGNFVEDCPQVFLPVEITEFNAAPSDDRVNLLWRTASEQRTESFEVQRSMDLEEWKTVGSTPAAGYSDYENEYFMVDYNPEIGVNYYRLKEIDTDGSIHYSDIRSALFKREEFTVYPNPASDRIWFKGDLSLVSSIRILNMQGQVVLEQANGSDPIREFQVNELSRGSYFVEFVYPNGDNHRTIIQVTR